MLDLSYIEAFGRPIDGDSYLFAGTVYTIEPNDDGEDTVVARPATNDEKGC